MVTESNPAFGLDGGLRRGQDGLMIRERRRFPRPPILARIGGGLIAVLLGVGAVHLVRPWHDALLARGVSRLAVLVVWAGIFVLLGVGVRALVERFFGRWSVSEESQR
jgi:hypothetical protein